MSIFRAVIKVLKLIFYRKYVQIIGRVSFRNCIEAYKIQSAGNEFDMELYSKALNLVMGKYADILV